MEALDKTIAYLLQQMELLQKISEGRTQAEVAAFIDEAVRLADASAAVGDVIRKLCETQLLYEREHHGTSDRTVQASCPDRI